MVFYLRDLINNLPFRHLSFPFLSIIGTNKHTHHILPVTFDLALADKPTSEVLDIVEKVPEALVFGRGQVSNIMKDLFGYVAPEGLENEIYCRGMEHSVDAE